MRFKKVTKCNSTLQTMGKKGVRMLVGVKHPPCSIDDTQHNTIGPDRIPDSYCKHVSGYVGGTDCAYRDIGR